MGAASQAAVPKLQPPPRPAPLLNSSPPSLMEPLFSSLAPLLKSSPSSMLISQRLHAGQCSGTQTPCLSLNSMAIRTESTRRASEPNKGIRLRAHVNGVKASFPPLLVLCQSELHNTCTNTLDHNEARKKGASCLGSIGIYHTSGL